MDIRRRMLFKKKASSSGGGGSTAGGSYTVNLNSQWEKTTAVTNPDSTLYDGVYRSSSSYNVNNGVSIMYITIKDCSSFKMYIRSYAESNYDYVMVSQLDKTITGSSSYSDTALVKAHTRGNQQSGTALSSYTLVEFTGITPGEHTITVVYRKDSSVNNGDDRGYVLINKINEGHGTVEPEEPESGGLGTINVGDIAYWSNGSIKTTPLSSWSSSLGTPVGVVVIPEGFAPDGKVRIVSLKYADKSGNQTDSSVFMEWGGKGTDTSLTNYNRIPITYNSNSNSTKIDTGGFLPSDKFTGAQSYVDPEAKYSSSSFLIPSPYSGDKPNPEYYKTISGYNNALSDFNGLSNTQTLFGLGSKYQAAGACWKYKDGASNLQWYLPAVGELGYLMPRCNLINASLTAVGGVAADNDYGFWASSEYSSDRVYRLFTDNGGMMDDNKEGYRCARPFCTIENNNKINTDDYLTIEALEDGLTASLSVNACEYCVDGDGNWKTLSAGTATESINSGHTLSFRGELTPITAGANQGIGNFTISKKCNLKGNCMSMLFGDNAANNYSLSDKRSAFYMLFRNCTKIVNVSSNFLPATTLANSCYYYMFEDCTNLTTAPELPATTLADYCYNNMFYGCRSLTTAPDLPATTLAERCYNNMFYNCTNLTTAPELPATTLAERCYNNMFYGCRSLTTAPELPATTLANYCYYSMFRGCTNLTTAPALPATTLSSYCYYFMFYNCTKLNYIKMLATDISATDCLSYWVNGVASTGTFVKNPAMNSLPTATSSNNYTGIPSGWTVVNDGEESGGNLITFTVDGIEYQAEEGMTWSEWCNSEYNVISVFISADGYVKCGNLEILTSTYNPVNSNKLILHGESYITSSHGGAIN